MLYLAFVFLVRLGVWETVSFEPMMHRGFLGWQYQASPFVFDTATDLKYRL
jgi:hypothetical protein